MGTKQKPGRYDCYAKALPDEPMFVLLARDRSAPDVVEQWAGHRIAAIDAGRRPEADRPMVVEAIQCATQMRLWRKANDGRWRKQEPAPLTREQLIERLTWMAEAPSGSAFPADWWDENGRWDNALREVAAAALDLIPGARPAGAVNHDTLKAIVFPDRYEDALTPAGREETDRQPIDAIYRADPEALARLRERGNPVEEEPSQAMRAAAMAMQAGVPLDDPDPLATARALVQQADYGRTSQAGAMAEWLIDPQGMAERQQQAGVPLEEDATAGTRLGRPPLSPSSLLLPEVKP